MKKVLLKALPPKYQFLAVASAAAFGNVIESFLRVPYEVIKGRLQAGQHINTMEAIKYSLKHEGMLGIFGQGKLTSQIIRDVPYAIITLVTYELLQSLVRKYLDKNPQHLKYKQLLNAVCGSIAVSFHFIFYFKRNVNEQIKTNEIN